MQGHGHHHLNVRKRIYKKLEPYPHPEALKRLLDRVMLFIAIGGPIALLPQVVQVYSLKDASDLSPITWILWECFSVFWLIYGIVHKEMPIIIANSCYIVLQAIVLIAIVIYR